MARSGPRVTNSPEVPTVKDFPCTSKAASNLHSEGYIFHVVRSQVTWQTASRAPRTVSLGILGIMRNELHQKNHRPGSQTATAGHCVAQDSLLSRAISKLLFILISSLKSSDRPECRELEETATRPVNFSATTQLTICNASPTTSDTYLRCTS